MRKVNDIHVLHNTYGKPCPKHTFYCKERVIFCFKRFIMLKVFHCDRHYEIFTFTLVKHLPFKSLMNKCLKMSMFMDFF